VHQAPDFVAHLGFARDRGVRRLVRTEEVVRAGVPGERLSHCLQKSTLEPCADVDLGHAASDHGRESVGW